MKEEIADGAVRPTGAVASVREAWTRWFRIHEPRLARVTARVADRLVSSVIAVAEHFSRTGDLIRVLSDPARFDEPASDKLG